MARSYYTLVVKYAGAQWGPEFGDYDREVVVDESMEYSDDTPVRVIKSGDSQPAIDAAVALLNA